jgi:hypothetical protein
MSMSVWDDWRRDVKRLGRCWTYVTDDGYFFTDNRTGIHPFGPWPTSAERDRECQNHNAWLKAEEEGCRTRR